jgi:uncharacterized membrane protein YkoI
MKSRSRFLVTGLVAVFALLMPLSAAGDTDDDASDSSQQDQARDAVRKGLVRPLEEVLALVRKTVKGDIVEIEFEFDDDNGRHVYEIEYVDPSGHLMEIKVDARTLAVISIGEEED